MPLYLLENRAIWNKTQACSWNSNWKQTFLKHLYLSYSTFRGVSYSHYLGLVILHYRLGLVNLTPYSNTFSRRLIDTFKRRSPLQLRLLLYLEWWFIYIDIIEPWSFTIFAIHCCFFLVLSFFGEKDSPFRALFVSNWTFYDFSPNSNFSILRSKYTGASYLQARDILNSFAVPIAIREWLIFSIYMLNNRLVFHRLMVFSYRINPSSSPLFLAILLPLAQSPSNY